MSRLSVRDLQVYLKQRTHEELAKDIVTLFRRFDAVKDYYQLQLDETSVKAITDRYKAVIRQEFFPERGFGKARLSVARRAITDCMKLVTSQHDIADLVLYYVEMGVEFTGAYGDIDEPFYNSMESMYERAAKFISQHNMQNQFAARCWKILRDTSGMGWGFHDRLSAIYDEYFEA
ncbi:MAG: hypothetical protein GYB65_02235 [Chloroflexi bacterium]|nr:hypothetical protein [Chloroflexota bacterium]